MLQATLNEADFHVTWAILIGSSYHPEGGRNIAGWWGDKRSLGDCQPSQDALGQKGIVSAADTENGAILR